MEQPKPGSVEEDLGKALLDSAQAGDLKHVRVLLANGAPIISDMIGTTPLHWAAHYNYYRIAELLLKAGISGDAKNSVDRTALHVAANKGFVKMAQLLITFGADPCAKDMLLNTPLHWAVESGNIDCVKIILDYGGDTDAVNKFGKTPSSMAQDYGYTEMYELLAEISRLKISSQLAKSAVLLRQKQKKIEKFNVEKLRSSGNDNPQPPSKRMRKSNVQEEEIITRDEVDDIVNLSDDSHEDSPSYTSEPARPNSTYSSLSQDKAKEILKSHGVTLIEADDTTVVSTAVQNGQTIRLTDAGKLALNLTKSLATNQPVMSSSITNSKEDRSPSSTTPDSSTVHLKTKLSHLSKGKRIIPIKADVLINMAKNKKVVIKKFLPIVNAKVINGNIYTVQGLCKMEIKCQIEEAESRVEKLTQLRDEQLALIEKLKKQLENLNHPKFPPT